MGSDRGQESTGPKTGSRCSVQLVWRAAGHKLRSGCSTHDQFGECISVHVLVLECRSVFLVFCRSCFTSDDSYYAGVFVAFCRSVVALSVGPRCTLHLCHRGFISCRAHTNSRSVFVFLRGLGG